MAWWTDTGILNFLWLGLLLLGAHTLVRRIALLQRLAIPPVLLAGLVGLILGPGGFGVLGLETPVLEATAYHGLAVVFIAMGLQPPPSREAGADPSARSAGIAITFISVAQGFLGLLLVLLSTGIGRPVHPGVGLMIPLGFAQGPGQAISLGRAWEEGFGMTEGAQVGLAMATQGYLWCCLLGLGLFHLGKARGWLDPAEPATHPESLGTAAEQTEEPVEMEPMTNHLALIGVVYLLTWGCLSALAALLVNNAKLSASIFGFHFLIGLGIAVAVRSLLARSKRQSWIRVGLLGRIAGVAVDVSAAAAIAAVRIDRLDGQMATIVAFGAVAAILTFLGCLWLCSRAFPRSPFSHAMVLFGTMTGTLPTGLALLRLADPQLSGPGPRSMVNGTTLSALLGLPLIVGVLPLAVVGWPDAHLPRVFLTLGVLFIYGLVLLLLWRKWAGLHFNDPGTLWWRRPDSSTPTS